MKPETIPIIIDRPDLDEVEIYPIHDLHYGNECFDAHRWNELSTIILSKPNRFVVFVGDLMENAIPNSKSDMFTQTATPKEQQEFVEALEGFDFLFCGHDHEPHDHARGHLVYDRQRRELKLKSVETLNSGSFLTYGGYGARAGYRPKSDKMYKLVLRAEPQRQKAVETVGFYI